jgi:hypothetical protein
MMRLYFTIRLLQLVVPPVILLIHFIIDLMGVALVSLWVGVPQAIDRLADEWIQRVIARGSIPVWDQHIYNTIRAMAFLTIVAGWVLLSHLVVLLVKWMF